MEASFIERWFESSSILDVYFVHELALFEVRAGDRVVFTSAELAAVLRWFLHDEVPEIDLADAEGVDPSPWEPNDE